MSEGMLPRMHLLISTPGELHPHQQQILLPPSLGISEAIPYISLLALWAANDQRHTSMVHPSLSWPRTHPPPYPSPGCSFLANAPLS